MTNEPRKIDLADELGTDKRANLKKMPEDMPSWMAKSIICLLYTSPSPRDLG